MENAYRASSSLIGSLVREALIILERQPFNLLFFVSRMFPSNSTKVKDADRERS